MACRRWACGAIRSSTRTATRIYSASDGSRRCLPATPGVTIAGYYADAACTQKLAQVPDDTRCAPLYALEQPPSCELRARVHAVGGRHTGMVYVRSGADCVSGTAGSPQYRTTGELAPALMVPLSDELR